MAASFAERENTANMQEALKLKEIHCKERKISWFWRKFEANLIKKIRLALIKKNSLEIIIYIFMFEP